MKAKLVFLIGFLAVFSLQAMAQSDTLYTATGDMLVGEVESMNKNILNFDTDYADSEFAVEWANVDGLTSSSMLIVYTVDGERYTGKLKYSGVEKRKVMLVGDEGDKALTLDEIVEITTLSQTFWDRIYISIDLGYSFTKANNVTQFTSNSRVNYKADKWKLAGYYNTLSSDQDDVEATKRNDGGIDYSLDILGDLFGFVGVEFLSNSEQMLDLRTTSKLGAGFYFVRTNQLFFQGGLGVANANEDYGGENPYSENSFEGLGMLEFDAFDIGDFSFRTLISAFPSFTIDNRWRVNADVSLKWDLPLDFYIKASYQHNFDSKPPAEGIPNSDYVFQTSVGWEWE